MKHYIISATLALITISLNAQNQNLQQVEGTNIFLSPPSEFTKSENFKGFQNPEDPYSMLMVVEMPGPFSEISAGFNEDKLAGAGMNLRKKEERKIAGKNGFYIELDQSASGFDFTKAILIFGDESKTSIINGTCLKEDQELYEVIKISVMNAQVDTNMVVDPRRELDFIVDESSFDLKFVSVVGNGVLFNRDGILPTESDDELNVLIDKSFAEVTISDLESFSKKRLAEIPGAFEVDENKGASEIIIDGLNGIQLWAGNNIGETLNQVILPLEDGGYYIFVATAKIVDAGLRDEIMDFYKTFKRKVNE